MLLLPLVLAACLPGAEAEIAMSRAAIAPGAIEVPPAVRRFGTRPGSLPQRSNADIAADILELTFRMESGRAVPVMSRFEEPVTVRLTGRVPPGAATDFARLAERLRREAGIDLTEVAAGPAAITIEFLPRRRIQQTYANVACFVVPNVSGWEEFRSRRGDATDWTAVVERQRVAIFLPSDSAPQEVRDCLHEEVAQALGPLNDLYRLTDSVFNDDNFHTVLTGFDMLVLRALYAPELASGMTETEVAARLPALLDRLNPAGARRWSAGSAGATPRVWQNALETALGGRGPVEQRIAAARDAVAMARGRGWHDGRMAISQFALGRLTLSRDPATALPALAAAARIWGGLPGGAIHVAHVEMQLAAFALTQGDAAGALRLADRVAPVAAASENAALMATVLMLRAEALELQGDPGAAAAERLDSRGWARYGFGADEQIRARMAEIAVLARRGGG
jgi:hypothetical protein